MPGAKCGTMLRSDWIALKGGSALDEGGCMRIVGFVATGLAALGVIVAGFAALFALPDFRRYRHIRKM
jgi:hypothetical protein